MTIKDIARISGVGISTVSRVLNNSGFVSDSTRRKVMEVIQTNNYVPNNNARNLKIAQSKNIALLVKGITNPFFNKLVNVIEQEITLRGYPLLIQNIDPSSNELDMAIQISKDRNLCGVIIMGGVFTYTEEQFKQLGIPCVLVTVSADKNVDLALYSSVCINDEAEGFRVTNYLISIGHRRIGFLYKDISEVPTPNSMRYQGYVRALEENNIPYDPNLVPINFQADDSGYKVGFQMAKALCMRNRDITAIFAFSDILAIGAAKAVMSLGMKIPDDVSIVGFDGIEMSEFYHPSLDTVYQPDVAMSLSSVEILFDMINGGKTQHVVYDTVLLKRGSSKGID